MGESNSVSSFKIKMIQLKAIENTINILKKQNQKRWEFSSRENSLMTNMHFLWHEYFVKLPPPPQ